MAEQCLQPAVTSLKRVDGLGYRLYGGGVRQLDVEVLRPTRRAVGSKIKVGRHNPVAVLSRLRGSTASANEAAHENVHSLLIDETSR